MDEEFLKELRDYTIKQMKANKSPEQIAKLVAELMSADR
ncbi:Protein of unknown function [Lactobacillus hominis DSM 23910 = CRBIP 24.179]|uniref:Uncharacterized protein n=1 Tax=Lactobacillus hominis DSM 23910 = CRBIP 24.179 TaxID=1423758 RepID=I7JUP4_9LACO|nr:Protein of unknown function [Lactobacillus hominis DSM 23910 = CRBIP 24.179]